VTLRKSPAKPAKGRAVRAAITGGSLIDTVVSAIPTRRKNMRIADICARVDLSEKQVRNAVARAVVQGRLRTTGRGIYARS
jgi:predicted DNA-binding transcriptional regulator